MKDITEIIPFGNQEPELSKLTKQLYVLVQYDSPIKKIQFKEFIKNIKEYCKIQDFPWTCKHKNGRKRYPSYNGVDGAKNWFKRYDYHGAYRTYAEYMNGENTTDLLLLEKTLQDNDIRQLFIIAQKILDEVEKLPNEPKFEYRRKASMETYKIIMDEIRERLQLNPENESAPDTIPIPDNPEQEDQHIRDIWTQRAEQDVIPR